MRLRSLRLRLTVIILAPLALLTLATGYWQVSEARTTAKEIFDRSLLTTALAVVGDVARSGGDALSIQTRDLLRDTSGGPVFYHVYAPDGVYVTGFATPPVSPTRAFEGDGVQFFDGLYHRREVRGLRLTDVATLDGISGVFTYTVWQDVAVREAVTRELSARALLVLSLILGALALVVWFGVRIGLRPLTDLEEAIARRGPGELRPIARPVPGEIEGMVRRLNTLFGQVGDAMAQQKTLVSNAAHQLRNPIAGVLAMAEAVRSAPDAEQARKRAGELLRSARHAQDLANKLLTLERAQSSAGALDLQETDLSELVAAVLADHAPAAAASGVRLVASAVPATALSARVDGMLLREALANLVHNALTHGGPDLSVVRVSAAETGNRVRLEVRDDGAGVASADYNRILARFGQAEPSEGSGLGLSIAEAVAERHGGALILAEARPGALANPGLSVTIDLPAADAAAPRPLPLSALRPPSPPPLRAEAAETAPQSGPRRSQA